MDEPPRQADPDTGRLVADIFELPNGDHRVRFEDGGMRTITTATGTTIRTPACPAPP